MTFNSQQITSNLQSLVDVDKNLIDRSNCLETCLGEIEKLESEFFNPRLTKKESPLRFILGQNLANKIKSLYQREKVQIRHKTAGYPWLRCVWRRLQARRAMRQVLTKAAQALQYQQK